MNMPKIQNTSNMTVKNQRKQMHIIDKKNKKKWKTSKNMTIEINIRNQYKT